MNAKISIAPTADEIATAARALGALAKVKFNGRRKVKRFWTGFIDGRRCWRGRLVVLPDGEIVQLKQAQRGFTCVRTNEFSSEGYFIHRYLPASSVRLHKLPAAVILGRLKRGKIEKKSETKAKSCRINGRRPARPGSRPRGRPRKDGLDRIEMRVPARTRGPYQVSLDRLLRRAIIEGNRRAARASRETAGRNVLCPCPT